MNSGEDRGDRMVSVEDSKTAYTTSYILPRAQCLDLGWEETNHYRNYSVACPSMNHIIHFNSTFSLQTRLMMFVERKYSAFAYSCI